MQTPLRYKISNLRQLPDCLSNNSRDLKINVTDFIQDDRLSGLRIAVNHKDFGTLFACVVGAKGNILSDVPSQYHDTFTVGQILAELERYGFLIVYNPVDALSGDQLQYLMTLRDLHYDKIRILDVHEYQTNGAEQFDPIVVAFNAKNLKYWLNNDYSPSKKEFTEALLKGEAINISTISDTRRYRWDWLKGFVANIDDVLKDNAEACLCP